jgi:hypothetical protein
MSAIIADFITNFIDNAGEEGMTVEGLRMLWMNEGRNEFIKLVEENTKKAIKKTKKTKKDKDAPKGARNVYILYCMEERPKVKEEFPDMKNQDIVAEMAKRWKNIQDDEEVLDYYRKLADDDKERAVKEKGEYVPVEAEEPKKGRKTTRTKTGYQLFLDDERASVKEDGFVGREVMVELGRRWKALPEEDEDRWQEYMKSAAELKTEKIVEEEEEEEKPKKKKTKKIVEEEEEEEKPKKKKTKKIVEVSEEEKPKKKRKTIKVEDDE